MDRKLMRIPSALLLILISLGYAAGQSQPKCFQFGALKDKHILRFEADGGDVAGSYFIERDYEATQTETYDFSGTRNAKTAHLLSVRFPDYKRLPNPPYEIMRATLTLINIGGVETMRAKFYGNNNKNVYSMELESCVPGYGALAKSAKRISFTRGTNSSTVVATFRNKDDRVPFWLNARRNQTIAVEALGCGISFFYPNKVVYEEGTAVDSFGLKLSQTGDYLFVVSPAGEPGQCNVTFKINN